MWELEECLLKLCVLFLPNAGFRLRNIRSIKAQPDRNKNVVRNNLWRKRNGVVGVYPNLSVPVGAIHL